MKKNKYSILTTLVVIIIFFFTWATIVQIEKYVKKDIEEYMTALLEITRESLHSWTNAQGKNSEIWAKEILPLTKELLKISPTREELISTALQNEIRNKLRPLYTENTYEGFFIISSDNINLASSRDENIGIVNNLIKQEIIFNRIWSGETVLSAPQISEIPLPNKVGILQENRATMFIGTPIKDEFKNIIALLLIRINPSKDFSAIFERSRFGNSGETYGVDKFGRLISNSRFTNQLEKIGILKPNDDGILQIKIKNPGVNLVKGEKSTISIDSLPLTLMAKSVIEGKRDNNLEGYLDYRGIPVIGMWTWDDELDFGTTIEIDKQEAFQAFYSIKLSIIILALGLTVLLFVFLFSYSWWRKRIVKSDEKFKNLSNLTIEGILIHDNCIAIDYNLSFLNLFGYKQEELLGKDIIQILFPKKYHEYIYKRFDDKSVHPIELEGIRKDGSIFPVEIETRDFQKKDNKKLRVVAIRDITERKKSDSHIKQLDIAINNSVNEVYVFDAASLNFSYVNKGVIDNLGYTFDELITMSPIDIKPKYTHKSFSKLLDPLSKGKVNKFQFWTIHQRKDKSTYPVEVNISKFMLNNELHYLALIIDITERNKSEEENKKLSTVIEQSANNIMITDTSGKVEYINPRFTEVSGYTEAEVLGKTPTILKSGKHSKEFYTELWETIKAGKIWKGQFHNKAKNGSLFWEQATITPIRNKEGKITNFLSIREDITRQKEAEKELVKAKEKAEESEAKLKQAQQIAKLGHWELDLVNNNLKWSDEVYRIFGIDPKRFPATYEAFMENIHKDDRNKVDNAYENSLKNRKPYKIEHRLLLKTGELKYVLEKCRTEYDNLGNPIRSLGTILDITTQKINEQKLVQAKEKAQESDRLKTEFLNNMSHEIRTPMNGILGFSEFLNDQNLDEKKRQNYIKIVQNSGYQLLRIIDDILEISKLETKQVTLKEEKTNLNDLLFEMFSIFDIKAKENQIFLYLEKGLSDRNSIILTDSVKLHKVLSNLLENAFKFTNDGQINFGYQINKKRIEFFVRDTGIGIPKNKSEIIFERFSQADKELSKKVGGLGLGLSIAKENVMLLGGDISVESKMSKGSTFRFDIPFKPYDSDIENYEKGTSDEIENGSTFLIVEDEEVNFMFIEILLLEKLKIKCNIIHAINGKEAVEICKNNANIDLVLMDLRMPVMNGFEATKLIKEFRPNLPIIAQSAYTSDDDRKRAEDAGCNDFISKPIQQEILNNSINNFIKR